MDSNSEESCSICYQNYNQWHFYGNLYHDLDDKMIDDYKLEFTVEPTALLDRIQLASCNHIFHFSCIAKMYEYDTNYNCCPLCRTELLQDGKLTVNVWNVQGDETTINMYTELISTVFIKKKLSNIFKDMVLIQVLRILIDNWWSAVYNLHS
ncbi:hypothetical protein BC833DRAFT_619504 [Globomyces pollinis-pini]|nr:hypothetical protein BC833DRAFT_619504 [Globomyces pollinis-pini]